MENKNITYYFLLHIWLKNSSRLSTSNACPFNLRIQLCMIALPWIPPVSHYLIQITLNSFHIETHKEAVNLTFSQVSSTSRLYTQLPKHYHPLSSGNFKAASFSTIIHWTYRNSRHFIGRETTIPSCWNILFHWNFENMQWIGKWCISLP